MKIHRKAMTNRGIVKPPIASRHGMSRSVIQRVLRSLVMRVKVNGKDRDVSAGSTIAALVASLGFGKRQVVVEHNGEPVERERFAEVTLAVGDVIEVVRPVQGGSR